MLPQSPTPDPEDNFPPILISIGFILLGFLATFLVVLIIVSLTTKEVKSIHMLIGRIFSAIPLFVFLIKNKYNLKRIFRIKMVKPYVLVASIILALTVPILLDEANRIISNILKIQEKDLEGIIKIFVATNLSDWVILVIGTVILASLIEEFFFRGLLQQSFEKKFEPGIAIAVTAMIFSLVHVQVWMVQVMLVSCLLGYLAWRSQSILPGIIIHSFNNFFALLQVNFELETGWYNWYSHVHPTIIAIAACITFYAIKWFNSLTPIPKEPNQIT